MRTFRYLGFLAVMFLLCFAAPSPADGLPGVKARGETYHSGIKYTNFVTGAGDDFDVALVQCFARYLCVKHKLVNFDFYGLIRNPLAKSANLDEMLQELFSDEVEFSLLNVLPASKRRAKNLADLAGSILNTAIQYPRNKGLPDKSGRGNIATAWSECRTGSDQQSFPATGARRRTEMGEQSVTDCASVILSNRNIGQGILNKHC